jgi:hypothetical protein
MNSSDRAAALTRCELRHRLFGLAVILLICAWPGHGSYGQTTYTISGTVAGLPAGGSVFLQDGTNTITISANGVFSYTSTAPTYNITSTSCSVVNGSGSLTGNVSNVVVSCLPAAPPPLSNWKQLATTAPGKTGTMLLLSDGTVMIEDTSQSTLWYKLSPDKYGHYVNGTFTTIHSSHCPHDEFASQVLQDGLVFVAGGEGGGPSGAPGCSDSNQVGTGVDTELYDPVTNTWSMADPPPSLIDPTIDPTNPPAGMKPNNYTPICNVKINGVQQARAAFLDMTSETLPDGSVLMAPVCPMSCGDTLIFNPKLYTGANGSGWSYGGKLANTGGTSLSCSQQESSWVKLRDGSILTADPPAGHRQPGGTYVQTSERYIPSLGQWVQDAVVGFPLFDDWFGYSDDGEEGPAFLLPNGNALFVGGYIYAGLYTPPVQGTAGSPPGIGAWSQITMTLDGAATGGAPLSSDDNFGAMMVNGKILLALNFEATAQNKVPAPLFFFEYDPSSATFTEVVGPGNPKAPSVWTDCTAGALNRMLDLPDGSVLMASNCDTTQLYVYQPSGAPLPLGQPTISGITKNSDGSYHLTGTGLNGISEGGAIGDDVQMATNYPLVRLTTADGTVHYARTHDWSGTGVQPSAAGTTEFNLPPGIPPGTYSLQVVANGNPSVPFSFNVPNACGGTGLLTSVPGAPCGQSCGRWLCNGPDSLICWGTNACGGCSSVPLAPGEGPQPGEPCSCGNGIQGRYFCTVSKQLSCDCQP